MICERMGWTYDDLQNTPEDFLMALYARIEVEDRRQAQQRKELDQKMARMKNMRKR